jgi:hypothetical protein
VQALIQVCSPASLTQRADEGRRGWRGCGASGAERRAMAWALRAVGVAHFLLFHLSSRHPYCPLSCIAHPATQSPPSRL